jgi:hypothetical protein
MNGIITSSLTPDLHSYSYIIRDGILQRLKAVPTFQSIKRWGTTQMLRVQPNQLPFFGCYFMQEQLRPDGDWDAGAPHFVNDLQIGFQLILESADEAVAENNLDAAYRTLMNLLTYQWWFRFPMPAPFPPVEIEGITRGQRRFKWGNPSITNETPVGELQCDLTYRFREFYLPGPFDDLRRIHVTVAYPWPYDPGAFDPPFVMQYDIPIEGEWLTQTPYWLQSPVFAKPKLDIVS